MKQSYANGRRGSVGVLVGVGLRERGRLLEGLDFVVALVGRQPPGKKILERTQEGVGGEEFRKSDAVSQIGELQGEFEMGGDFPENFKLLDLRLAHLGFDLKQQFPQALQVVFPLPVFPALVAQKAQVLLSGQGAVRDDFAHRRRFSWGKCIISPCGFKPKRVIN
jgi:hypothetical protein